MTQTPEEEMATEDTAPITVPDPPSTQRPSKGRIVMYVTGLVGDDGHGRHVEPAIVVRVHPDGTTVNLKVFADEDDESVAPAVYRAKNVLFYPGEKPTFNTWHWPARV